MFDLSTLIYTNEEILARRKEAALRLTSDSPNIKSLSINRMSSSDLKLLFDLYDEIFFEQQFAKEYKGRINFSLSTRLIKAAGKTLSPKNIIQLKPENLALEIRIGTYFFFKYDEIESEKSVAGIVTSSALEALQLVFEHELCHVIELIMFKTSNCSRERFKTLARNLFGHTESTHQLPTPRHIAQQKYGFKIGHRVSFYFDNRRLEGILYRINKRATVMVQDDKGDHIDKQGNRYIKYFVPINCLELCDQTYGGFIGDSG
ncbi:MAG: hypothetical protein ACOX0F_07845 [Syntrophomonadaceae bacterium]|jgi:predicted SprT family Zn-dependent metalloprotease